MQFLETLKKVLHLDRPPGRRALPTYDASVVWLALILLSVGLVMVYSASIAMAEADKATHYRYTYYLLRHATFLGVAALMAFTAYQIRLSDWQRYAPWLFLTGALLLIIVLIPGIGKEVNGSRRWLSLGVINFQPSEFMKLFAVLYAADYTVRKAKDMSSNFVNSLLKGFIPMFIVMLMTGGLLLTEPDFGAFAVITAIAVGILLLGGMNGRVFLVLMLLLVIGFIVIVVVSPYRMQRIAGFLNPWADPFGKGYQLSHALIAFGRGSWLGVGLGGSVEKLFYLPEAHTDFLLAVIAEELGLLGVLIILGLFVALIYRAFRIGQTALELGAERHFAALVAQGIAIWLGIQAFINMGVNMGLMPTKGLTLPLLSFGGSGIVANCVAIAILMRIDVENRQWGKRERGGNR